MLPKNPNPTFDRPKHHKARPAFLRGCHTQLSKKVPLSRWDGWHLIQHVHGKSKIYENAQRSMDAIALSIVHYVDLQSGAVGRNVTEIAEDTGLVTQSEKGNISISRCSRAIIRMIDAGLLEAAPLVWDKELGCYLPKFINVTDLFWQVAHPEGFEGYQKAREKQFQHQNEGLSNPNEWLTITEAKERRHRIHIKKAFEFRRDKQLKNKERRTAKKLGDKENKLARGKIAKDILDSVDTCHGLTFDSFSSLINQRTALYRKMSDDPDPPKH